MPSSCRESPPDQSQVDLIHKGNEEQIPLFVHSIYLIILNSLKCSLFLHSSAYELYADFEADQKTVSLAERLKRVLQLAKREVPENPPGPKPIPMAERFKQAFSRKDVKVHFVGAW